MEFRLLGPFEARHDGRPVVVGGRRQERFLLAVLLLHADQAVPAERLMDLMWGTSSGSPRATLHTYVGRLRASLAPFGVRILTRHSGYLVEGDGHTVDAREFTGLVGRAAAAGDPAERVRLYGDALALWGGPLLADVADDELRDRLDGALGLGEARLTALELRAEAQLTMGLHERVAEDLAPFVRLLPGRERLVLAQMTALYRCGRRAEALELFGDTRVRLAEELGIGPGPALTELHGRMLRDDPRLDRPPAPLYAVRVGEEWLPWTTSGHPALEFCNTYAGWGSSGPLPGSDWLRRYSALAVWSGHLGLADDHDVTRLLGHASRNPSEATAVLEAARAFRSKLYACLTDPGDAHAFRAVADAAQRAAALAVLTRGDGGLASWRLPPAAGLSLPVHAVALSAAELLMDARRFTVRRCPGADCGWLFLDEAGRRRWCSLATCGRPASPGGPGTAGQ
ncbi:AfsR/SARP family transcriptional regulator [Streptomyces chilikensis]|uniref:AfsR/SARP family transcriptional regulator n=1 Tax=Streptomyces chilikensis TaxID=1194079 RepID=UPI00140AFA61|nr:AfsR/SARP family transcriptional regulator [Streptomyces chilikensis]